MRDTLLNNLRLFNCIGYIESDGKINVNYQLERLWKEMIKACFITQEFSWND